MFQFVFNALFGCTHPRTTFPITVSRPGPNIDEQQRRTYVACLDCGEELAYNWQKMQTEGRCREVPQLQPKVVSADHGHSLFARILHAPHRTFARPR